MTGEIWFYHLEGSGLDVTLAPLIEKCLQRRWRVVVRGGSEQRLDELDANLWTFKEESFLPHGRAGKDGGEIQPVWLTGGSDNPNGAKALFALDGADFSDTAKFERAIVLFDGRDEAALTAARDQWKTAKGMGLGLSYWKETAAGRWEKQA